MQFKGHKAGYLAGFKLDLCESYASKHKRSSIPVDLSHHSLNERRLHTCGVAIDVVHARRACSEAHAVWQVGPMDAPIRGLPGAAQSVRSMLAEIVTKKENFAGNFHILRNREQAYICTDVQKALIFNRAVFHVH